MILRQYLYTYPEQIVLLMGLLGMASCVKRHALYYHRTMVIYIVTCLSAFFFSSFGHQAAVITDLYFNPCQIAYIFSALCAYFVHYDTYEHKQEVFMLMLGSLIGFSILVYADHFMTLYLGLELLSLPLYALVGLSGKEHASEAAVKYYFQGSLASALFLFGASWLYGLTGALDLSTMLALKQTSELALFSNIFIIGLFFFKLGLAPFHFWTFDIYEQAQSSLILFLGFIPKMALFCVLAKFLVLSSYDWSLVIMALVMTTTVVGNLGALGQTSLQRFLGYTSLAQVAFALSSLLILPHGLGLGLSLFFITIYTLGMSFIFVSIQPIETSQAFCLNQLNGLAYKNQYAALMMSLGLLSLAGIPPFPGFFAKAFILYYLIFAKLWMLAGFLLLLSIISCGYYITLVARIYNSALEDFSMSSSSETIN
jgi:NADH-quinone oxidoreductase subunit N